MSEKNDVRIDVVGSVVGFKGATAQAQRELDGLKDKVMQAGAGLGTLEQAGVKTGQAMGGLAEMGRLAAAAFVGSQLVSGIKAVGAAMFEASAAADRLRTQLSFSTGNVGREMDYLRGLTNKMGLEFTSTAKAYSGFAAAARGTAMEGQKTREVFEAISKASAVMGLTTAEASGALLAVQQMMSKGVVNAEEFRGQLGERMPIALQAGAKALNVTTAEFSKMMETGKIVAEDFLPKFAQAITEMLGDAPENAANRLDAATNRMANAWDRLKQSVGDAGVSKAIANDMNALTATADAMSESMTRAGQQGSGGLLQVANAAGVLIGRGALGGVTSLAESVNAAINLLSGGVFNLSTNISVLPNNLRPAAEALGVVEGKLKTAQAEYDALAQRVAKAPDNIYIRSELGELGRYIAKLKEARGELAAFTGATMRESYGNEGRGATQKFNADAAALAASQKRASAYGELIVKYASKDEKKATALREARENLGEFFNPDVEKRIRDSFDGGGGKGGGGGGGGAAKVSDYARTMETLRERVAVTELELNATEKLTAAEREHAKWQADVDSGRQKLTKTQYAAAEAEWQEYLALDKKNAAYQAFLHGVERQEQANVKATQAMIERIANAKEETEVYGLTEAQISAVAQARLTDAIAMAEENGATPEMLQALRDELELRGKLTDALSARDKKKYDLEDAKKAVSDTGKEMDEFAKQAARNMQDAMANFFIDPTNKGIQSIGKTFAETVQKMIAQAGSAQLMKLLFGDMGSTGNVGGFVGSLFSGASGLFGGGGGGAAAGIDWASYVVPTWHAGGMVEPGGQTSLRLVPAGAFADARRFHQGGIAGDEVPAILKRGERVLTADQQKGAGGMVINQTINAGSGTDKAEVRRAAAAGARSVLGVANGALRYG